MGFLVRVLLTTSAAQPISLASTLKKVVLEPLQSASSDHEVKEGRLVHRGCYDDCQQYEMKFY